MIENLFGGGGGGGLESVVAGTGISVDNTNPDNPIITNTSLNTDETAKVSSNDTTAGFLNGKLVAGTNVTITENNDGGNETLTIAAAGGETTYTVTIADVENTTTETTVAQFTVPANSWADGEEIILDMMFIALQNTGASRQVTYKVGGTTITDSTSSALTAGLITTATPNFTRLRFVRLGNGVAFTPVQYNAASTSVSTVGAWGPLLPSGLNLTTALDTAVTFTSDITIYFKVTLNFASPSFYARCEHARAYKRAAGTV